MIQKHSVTALAIAGILTLLINTIATAFISILLAITLLIVVAPIVGAPLTALLILTARILGIDQTFLNDTFNVMLGGFSKSLLLLAILVFIGSGIRAWRTFLEARHSWIGVSFLLLGFLTCIGILFYLGVKSTNLFGPAIGLALAFVQAPIAVAAFLVAYVPFLGDAWTSLKGIWTKGGVDYGQGALGAVAVALSTYVFYSLISTVVVILSGLCASSMFRRALQFQLSGLAPRNNARRFEILPRAVEIGTALFNLLKAVLISILAGFLVSISYLGIYLLALNSDRLSAWLFDVATMIGVTAPQNGWLVGTFLAGSIILVIGSAACLLTNVLFHMPLFPSTQLKEWLVVLLVSSVTYVALTNTGVESSDAPFLVHFFTPIALILRMARGLIWRVMVESRERILSGQQRSVEDVIKSSDIAPILYLRAFLDDGLTVGRGFRLLDLLMGMPVRRRRFEEIVAGRAFHWRPIVALGNPHIPFNLHGVLKKSVAGQDWKSEVEYWHKRSAYVLMIANKTDNIAWEIELIRQTRGSESAIFVVTSTARAREFFDHYAIIAKDSRVPDNTLVVYRDPSDGWVALTSRLRSEIAYTTALDIALARTESAMSKSSQAALTHLAS